MGKSVLMPELMIQKTGGAAVAAVAANGARAREQGAPGSADARGKGGETQSGRDAVAGTKATSIRTSMAQL